MAPPPTVFCILFGVLISIVIQSRFVTSFSTPIHIKKSLRHASERASHKMPLAMAKGMGMGTKSVSDKGMGKTNPKNDKKKGGSSAPFDVAKAMMRSEKLYDELMTGSSKASNGPDEWDELFGTDDAVDITSEYIIAARGKHGTTLPKANSALVAASDWVPVAQLCIVRPVHDEGEGVNLAVRAAVSFYCREINYAACLAAPSTFKSLPRNAVEYSAEPIDSFLKHVYEGVIEGRTNGNYAEGDSAVSMTKTKAREVLGLDPECKDAALIKQAYKKMSFEFHPDRFANKSERTQEEIDASSRQFLLVKMAYESLTSGVRGEVKANGVSQSWYESLGGKSRTEFIGPIDLMSVESASALCNKAFKSAVVGLDHDLTMAFVARNQAAAR